jgi:hypothetical protein
VVARPTSTLTSRAFCSHETSGIGTLDNQNLSIRVCQIRTKALDDLGSQDGAGGSLLSVGEPRIHIHRVYDVLEHDLAVEGEELLPDQGRHDGTAGVNIPDVRGIVQRPDLVRLLSDAEQDARVFRFWMNVEQNPTRSKRPMKKSQRVTDTLTRYSSQEPGENRDVESLVRQTHALHVAGAEGDDRLQRLRCAPLCPGNAIPVRIECQDRPRLLRIAPGHPSIA